MFGKLNQIVKESSQKDVFLNAGIAENSLEAAINEASGVMVDVLKNQVETGKAKDVLTVFKGRKSERETIIMIMVKKFANRLNRYYGINSLEARKLSNCIIPIAMDKFILEIAEDKKEGNGIFLLLNWLGGNRVNFEKFFIRTNQLQIA
ncbi:hypothetical protein I5M32_12385 [Pedobacter sp. SD-b]|uniref:Uncharacterized protein n=1 Tax=Pedobacter segetis TaxID=2793069 RepID=A0ABS1BLJ2_9SPHI|nr:hypothetical protein [Pedobacter segetis]MBK0383758.1 hypothetical protein [Pedobacter segetis]